MHVLLEGRGKPGVSNSPSTFYFKLPFKFQGQLNFQEIYGLALGHNSALRNLKYFPRDAMDNLINCVSRLTPQIESHTFWANTSLFAMDKKV
jgi:hypothetical protein